MAIEPIEQVTSDLRTRREAAAYLRVPENTLKHWARMRKGPQFARIGLRVYYRQSELDAWLDAQFGGGEAA